MKDEGAIAEADGEDSGKIISIPEPFQMLQKMDQLGNDIIKNKSGNSQ